jgi:hypothetical protein
MPSIGSFKAQPLTKTFAITQGPNQVGVYYFTPQGFNTWYSANTDNITKISDSFFIVTGNFYDIVYDNDNDNRLRNSGTYDGRKSLVDFGKEIVIGNPVNSRLLVFRRVQVWADSSIGGDGREFYVLTENNTEDAGSEYGRFTVRVARA